MWISKRNPCATQINVAMKDSFVLVLLLHPSISGNAMEFFRCESPVPGAPSYLMADYSEECQCVCLGIGVVLSKSTFL